MATVVPSALGLLVLGDSARDGFAPVTVIGFAITVGAVLGLTVARVASTHGT